VLAFFREVGRRGGALNAQWQSAFRTWEAAHPDLAQEFQQIAAGKPTTSLAWPQFDAANGSVATRDAGGLVMNAIAASLPELIGGSADLDPSTKTYLHGAGDFEPGSYEGRNIHFGVREHAMGAIANGIAYHGSLLPFTATFFNFSDYMKPAIRLAALSNLHVLFIFTHDSIFLGEDGPTHQPVEQLAMLRAMPNLTVVRPADALEVAEAWKLMIAPQSGPWALVLTRQKTPFLGERVAAVERGAYIIADAGGTADLILIATGSEVACALETRRLLAAGGIAARVVSMPSWELFERQPQSYRDEVLPPGITARMSIEAAATFGWERWTGSQGYAFGVDRFGASAPLAAIAEAYGFTPANLAAVATERFAFATH
ncbi:MAG: transketolase-like TK C-terminal-containing protein, partial [Vulcanimicrobiaceae bacterium]